MLVLTRLAAAQPCGASGQLWVEALSGCYPQLPCPRLFERDGEGCAMESPLREGLSEQAALGIALSEQAGDLSRADRSPVLWTLALDLLEDAPPDLLTVAARGDALAGLGQLEAAFETMAAGADAASAADRPLLLSRACEIARDQLIAAEVAEIRAPGGGGEVRAALDRLTATSAALEAAEASRTDQLLAAYCAQDLALALSRADEHEAAAEALVRVAAMEDPTFRTALLEQAEAVRSGVAAGEEPAAIRAARLEPWAEGSMALSAALLRALSRPGEDVAVSPWIAVRSGALVQAGARGEALAQLTEALSLSTDPAAAAGYAALEAHLSSLGLSSETALLVDARQHLQPDFLAAAREGYGIVPQRADLREGMVWSPCEGATVDIGRGAAFAVGGCAQLDRAWRLPFEEAETRTRPFLGVEGGAEMMHSTHWMPYARLPGAQAVSLDYQGGLAMMVVLPDEGTPLPALLDGEVLERLRDALEGERVALALPRFGFTSATRLLPVLAGPLGAPLLSECDPGRPHADFSGMIAGSETAGQVGVCLSALDQRVRVAVDEAGTQAAGVGVIMGRPIIIGVGPEPPPIPVTVDRPFVWLITDPLSGVVVFAGVTINP